MTVKELVSILEQCDQTLMVRVETGEDPNMWVHGVEQHNTGQSGYELNGEVVLIIGE
jgi:hypothetical protein